MDLSQRNYSNRDEVDDIHPLQNLLPLEELEREDGEKEAVEKLEEIISVVQEKEKEKEEEVEIQAPPAKKLDTGSEIFTDPEVSGGYSDGEVRSSDL